MGRNCLASNSGLGVSGTPGGFGTEEENEGDEGVSRFGLTSTWRRWLGSAYTHIKALREALGIVKNSVTDLAKDVSEAVGDASLARVAASELEARVGTCVSGVKTRLEYTEVTLGGLVGSLRQLEETVSTE